MNTIIQRLNGTTYDLAELGIFTRDFNVSAPKPRHFTEQVDAMHGAIDMGTVYDPRPISASFYAKAVDYDDYALMRDEIFRMFRSDEAFYVIESRNPGKRWLVKVADSFGLDQQFLYGFFDVEFIAYSGFAESIGTTQDAFTFDAELWQFGEGLTADDLIYTFNSPSFRVYNAGDIAINPRNMTLDITFTGASSNLTIKNETTGDLWKYTGNTGASDVVKLTGVRAIKNGLSIFRDTNRKLITIAPGWNDFTITGASGNFTVKFDFRFYYL
jgi:Phage tail protein